VKEKDAVINQIVLNKTPFYAESGGQVGDTGVLESKTESIEVFDTKKENDLIIHYTRVLPADLKANFSAKVDNEKRLLTMNNHSATHLMHAALRKVLGNHVEQRGSLVNEHLLRFDFSHFAKLTSEEISEVERIVNARIRDNIALDEKANVPIEEAKKMGAMALFGEKYGDRVRVITFDKNYSVELCGGTHVNATGSIGFFKITSESSIAAGIRRIEAVTAVAAEDFVQGQENALKKVKQLLNSPADMEVALSKLLTENKALEDQVSQLQRAQAGDIKKELIAGAETVNGLSSIIAQVDLQDAGEVKNLAFQLKNEVKNLFLVLAVVINDKPQLTVAISDEVIASHNLHAGNIVRELAQEIKGGGGGQPFFATAGGSDASGIANALAKAGKVIQ
jgi:alanyl-tRNA synthetase